MSFSSVLFSSMSNCANGNCNSNIIEKTLNSKAETSIPRSTMFLFLRLCHSFLKTIHSLLEAVTFIIFLQKHAPLVEYLMRPVPIAEWKDMNEELQASSPNTSKFLYFLNLSPKHKLDKGNWSQNKHWLQLDSFGRYIRW